MADFAEVLQGFSSLVVDYSAFLELSDPDILDSLIGTIVDQGKTVYISKAFKAFHESVVKADNPYENEIATSIKRALRVLVGAKLLRASKHASDVSFFLEHLKNEDECFFIGRNSNSFARLRNINAEGMSSIFVIDQCNIRFYPSISECMQEEKAYSVNPIAGNSDFIECDIYFSVGDSVYTDEGERVTLTSLISTGAEGLVFNTDTDSLVAKVYHRGGITPLRWYKLMKMRQLGLDAENVCWPYRLLFSKDKVPVGYLMRKASGTTISRAFDGPDAMENYFPYFTRQHIVEATLSFLRIMDYLHLHGVIVGDIQLKNAMIDDEDHVYLIDIDSVQYQDLPCPVGTEEFTRPELWDKSFVSFLRRPQDEDYSIAILVFSMLFCGQHPYAQRNGLETLRDEMAARSFPYTLDGSENDRIPIGGYDKIWDALTPELKDMFVRAFAKGELFDSAEWTVALEEYRTKLDNHEIEDEENYRAFPYYVEETVAAPKHKGGKVSVREAVMNSAMNTEEATNSYNKQLGLAIEPKSAPKQAPKAEKPEPKPREAVSPSFRGSNQAPSNSAFKPATNTPSAASAVANRPTNSSAASQQGFSASSNNSIPKNEGFFGFFKRSKLSLVLLILLVAAIGVLVYYMSV
ncbi:MAG: hypothetical protein J6Y08_00945 [Clostridiales bacterium]|nr:hypothetical protein [Clostridiales bacterium]